MACNGYLEIISRQVVRLLADRYLSPRFRGFQANWVSQGLRAGLEPVALRARRERS